MKKLILALFMLMGLSCQERHQDVRILSHEEMVDYLIDLHLSEAQVQSLRLSRDSSANLFAIFEKKLLADHNVSDTSLVASYSYYLERPIEMEEIYVRVVDSLTLRLTLAK